MSIMFINDLSAQAIFKALFLPLITASIVIVAISRPVASAQANNCKTPGPTLGHFTVQSPPRPSPNVAFYDVNDNPLTIESYKGKGVVLNYWATWCAPCVKEMPALSKLHAELDKEGITVLALSQDRGGAAKVKKFYAKTGIENLDILIDKKGKVARKSAVMGLPVTILVDADGMERGRVRGMAEWDAPESIAFIRDCLKPAG